MPLVDINTVQNNGNNPGVQITPSPIAAPNNNQANLNDIANNLDAKLQQTAQVMPQQMDQNQSIQAQPGLPNQNQVQDINQANGQVPIQNVPTEREMNIHEILEAAISKEASDIHLTSEYKAMLRISGLLSNLQTPALKPETIYEYAKILVQGRKDINLDEMTNADLSYAYKDRRFRVNIFKEMGNYAIVMRLIPMEIKSIDELGLPQIFHDFTKVPAGLILMTGPTGSGKSTTLASIINEINIGQRKHIVTIEDPIEFVYPIKQSIIEQREMGLDFKNFPEALKSLLRQDPNVILVGEMRDYETISSAITVAETGHLVFATLHTNSAPQSIDRIIDVFPETQQAQIRSQLANMVVAIVAQRLVKLNDGGRKAVHEIMLATPAVKNAIREQKTFQIDNMIQTGQDVGMVQMEKQLAELVFSNQITREEAFAVTVKPKELEILLK